MSTPSTPLTRKDFIALPTEELRKIVHDPARLAEVNAILSGPAEPTPDPVPVDLVPDPANPDAIPPVPLVDAAKVEADRLAAEAQAVEAAATAKAEADKVAKQAETDAYKAAGLTVETDQNGNIVKIVKTYQARDDAGNAIGRPTYLESKSWAELSVKQQTAHENAVRFAERVKKQQFTKKKDEPVIQVLTDTELLQLQEELKGEDRDKAAQAAEKVRVNDDRKRVLEADQAIKNALAAKESYKFLAKHVHDYNNCEANNNILNGYITDNNLEWTEQNLEAALIAVESQLAPKEQPAPVASANPVPTTPAPIVPPPTVVAPPAPPAAPNAPASQPVAPPAPRPGVNGGLVPGEQSAPRPSSQPKGLTKADIKAMSREEYRRRLSDPKFVAEVNALLAKR